MNNLSSSADCAGERHSSTEKLIRAYSLFISIFFLVASPIAVYYTKEWDFFDNLFEIITSPCPLVTDYFALGGLGTDATEQIADIVLINDDLTKLVDGLKIAKKTKNIIWQNIIFALLIKLIFLVISPFNIINDILIYGGQMMQK